MIDLSKEIKKLRSDKSDVRLNISLTLKADCDWAQAGHEVAYEQLVLRNNILDVAKKDIRRGAKLVMTDQRDAVIVKNKDVSFMWSKSKAALEKVIYGNRVVFDSKDTLSANYFQAFRAPTDNDKSFGNWLAKDWKNNAMECPKVDALSCTSRLLEDNQVEVKTVQQYNYKSGSILVESTWIVYGDGTMDLKQTYTPQGELPELPRLGCVFVADKAFDNVEWYGYGPMETYPDRHRAAFVGWWNAKAGDQYTHYARPQDSGNLESVAVIRLTDKKGTGVQVTALDKTFSASALPYSTMDIYNASHDCDLKASGAVYLNLDAAVLGLGNSSCGPGVLKKYAIEKKAHTLNVRISPYKRK